MTYEKEKTILDNELKCLNEEIKNLQYRLSELLNLDCTFGLCTFDPEVDNVQEKMKDIEEKRKLLEFIRNHIDSYRAS